MASCAPVDAPDGTAARPIEPSSSTTSTSTVGLPRLSRISRPMMSMMAVMCAGPFERELQDWRPLSESTPKERGPAVVCRAFLHLPASSDPVWRNLVVVVAGVAHLVAVASCQFADVVHRRGKQLLLGERHDIAAPARFIVERRPRYCVI